MRSRWIEIVLALTLALPGSATARGGVSGLAEADATSLSARGIEAPFGNPATLSWDRTLVTGIASATGQIQNDTFNWDDYRRWNGATWSEEDKRQILARIRDDKVRGRLESGLYPPSVAWSGWALASRRIQAGVLEVPRDYAELAFFGNRLDETVVLPTSTGEGVELLDVTVSHGRRLGTIRDFEVSAGGNAHWLYGTRFDELVDTRGSLVTGLDVLDGEIVAISRTADGGQGYAIDVSLAARSSAASAGATGENRSLGVHGPYEFGLVMRNVVGSIRWSKNPLLHEDSARADSLTLEHTGEGDLVETVSGATPIGAFTRGRPRELTTAGACWVSEFRLELDWTQGFAEGPRITRSPRLALGASFWRWHALTPRAGLAVGGIDGPVLAGGFRVRFWRCALDLAYQSLGSLHVFLPKGVGIGAALTFYPLPAAR